MERRDLRAIDHHSPYGGRGNVVGGEQYRKVTDADLASLGYHRINLEHVRRMIGNEEIYDLEAYFDRLAAIDQEDTP